MKSNGLEYTHKYYESLLLYGTVERGNNEFIYLMFFANAHWLNDDRVLQRFTILWTSRLKRNTCQVVHNQNSPKWQCDLCFLTISCCIWTNKTWNSKERKSVSCDLAKTVGTFVETETFNKLVKIILHIF